jgi:Ca2+-binding RTX toxin-like protein
VGGAGDDVLNGELGTDWLVGGTGHDVFVFTNQPTNRVDIVQDFEVGEDRINLSRMFAKSTYAGANASKQWQYMQMEQTQAETVIKIDTDGSGVGTRFTLVLLLAGVSKDSRTSA